MLLKEDLIQYVFIKKLCNSGKIIAVFKKVDYILN